VQRRVQKEEMMDLANIGSLHIGDRAAVFVSDAEVIVAGGAEHGNSELSPSETVGNVISCHGWPVPLAFADKLVITWPL
jgi:hypothetical protein